MQAHIFRAKLLGKENEYDIVWFLASKYTKEEAEANFVPKVGLTNKNGNEYPYTYYEYEGAKYYKYTYLGLKDVEQLDTL